jgi:hypothetical protein
MHQLIIRNSAAGPAISLNLTAITQIIICEEFEGNSLSIIIGRDYKLISTGSLEWCQHLFRFITELLDGDGRIEIDITEVRRLYNGIKKRVNKKKG